MGISDYKMNELKNENSSYSNSDSTGFSWEKSKALLLQFLNYHHNCNLLFIFHFFSHLNGISSFISINKTIIVGINIIKPFLIKIIAEEEMLSKDAYLIIDFIHVKHIVPILIASASNDSDLGFNASIIGKNEFPVQG